MASRHQLASAAAKQQRRSPLRLRIFLAALAAVTLLAAWKLSIGRDRGARSGDSGGARSVSSIRRRRDFYRKRRSGGDATFGAVQLSLLRAKRTPTRRPDNACFKDLASALTTGYKRVGRLNEEQVATSILLPSNISSSSAAMLADDNEHDLSSVYAWDPPAACASSPSSSSLSSSSSSSSASSSENEKTTSSSFSSSSWFDSQDWGSLYPRCTQADEWCDARYPLGETDAVQRALYAHQNPLNCDRARLLLLSDEYSSGLGSSLHIHAYMLSLAISDNRVLVVDPRAGWEYAPRGLCACDEDVEERPKACEPGTVLSNKDCFFLPASRCPLPGSKGKDGGGDDWRTMAPQFSPGSDARVMQARSFYDYFGVSQCDIMVLAREMTTAAKTGNSGGGDVAAGAKRGSKNGSGDGASATTSADPSPSSSSKMDEEEEKGEREKLQAHRRNRAAALAAFADRPPSWWLAQLMKYMLRPRPRVLRDFVAPMQAQAFGLAKKKNGTSSSSLPHPLASVFIRGGDKGKESALLPAQAYFDELEPLAEMLGIRDVYASSDGGDAIEAVRRAYGGFEESASGGNGGSDADDDDDDAANDNKNKKTSPPRRRRQYRVHAIDWPRPRGGVTFAQVLAWRDRPEMEDMVRLAPADVFVTAQADVQAGTLSSNWCRIGDMLRRAIGKGRLPYVTPERPALWVASCESVEPGGKDYAARAVELPKARARLWEAPSWVE